VIDPKKLPGRVMLDTNVLYFVFDKPQGRLQEAPAVALWNALVQHKRDILVATPTLAEFFRFGGKAPSAHGLTYIAFDQVAAMITGAAFPAPQIKQAGAQAGCSKPAIKFDTLIMGCAARGRADALITYDNGFAALKANAATNVFANLQILSPYQFLPPPAPQPPAQAAAPAAQPPFNPSSWP
jgi:predicted nucleic acid-binding protein